MSEVKIERYSLEPGFAVGDNVVVWGDPDKRPAIVTEVDEEGVIIAYKRLKESNGVSAAQAASGEES